MLVKLTKYGLKDLYKILIIFYILAIFFASMTRIFFETANSLAGNVIANILSGVTISMIFNILINNILRMWANFRRNLYGDESYLTHTLPVTKSEIYLSKTLTMTISLFLDVLVIALSLFIAYGTRQNLEALKNSLFPFEELLGGDFYLFIIAIFLILFLELLNGAQCGFSGIILGHKMNGGKIGFSVLYGFIYYSASQVFVVVVTLIAGLFNKDVMKIFTETEGYLPSFDTLKLVIILALISYALAVAITYFVNLKIFKKGVNVD